MIIFVILYFLFGVTLGSCIYNTFESYLFEYYWLYPVFILIEFICVGVIPVLLFVITFC